MNRRRRLCSIAGALWLFAAASGAPPSDEGDEQALLADADYAAGLSALKASDPASALRRFQAALKRFPDAAGLYNELGYASRKLGRLDQAFVDGDTQEVRSCCLTKECYSWARCRFGFFSSIFMACRARSARPPPRL